MHRKHTSLTSGTIAFFFFALFFVVFSVTFYQRTQLSSRAMSAIEFRTVLSQKGIQLPSPLPETMSDAQYAQLAQFAGITVSEAKMLFAQLKTEEASSSANQVSTTVSPSPTAQNNTIPTSTPVGTSFPSVTPVAQTSTTSVDGNYDESIREGIFTPVHEDFFAEGTTRMRYYLHKDDKYVELEASDALATVIPRSYIRIQGDVLKDHKLQTVSDTGNSLIQTVQAMDPKTISPQVIVTGSKKVATVLLNFPSSQFTSPTQASAQSHVNGELKDFLTENSNSRLTMTGDAFGPYMATIPNTCEPTTFAREAVRLSDPQVDYTKYTHLMVVVPTFCPWGGIGALGWMQQFSTQEGYVNMYISGIRSDNFGLRVTSHELGHNFGGYHANGWECGAKITSTTCPTDEYADDWDALGSANPYHFNGYHKNLFGWLTPANTITTSTSGTYTLKSIELNTTQPQVLRVDNPLTNWYYYVEGRKAVGFDSQLPSAVTNGALIRVAPVINGCSASCGDTHIVDRTPGSAGGENDFNDAYWPVGTAMVDQTAGFAISIVSKTADDLTVKVIKLENPATLTSPARGEITSSLTPTFVWTAVPDATDYTIQASLASNFSSLLFSQTLNGTSYTPTTPLPLGKVIYWRVQAKAGEFVGPMSLVNSFSTPVPPGAPVLTTPATNTLVQVDAVTLGWKAPTSGIPASYHLQVSTATGTAFDSAIVFENTTLSANSLSLTLPTLPRVKQYYWRVRTTNAQGHSSVWSTIWTFKIAPEKPVLVSPSTGATNVLTPTPTLNWNDVSGATNYYIQVSRNSAFTSLLVNKLTGSTASEFTTPALVEGIPVYWRVYAVSTVGNSSYSDVWSFTTADAPTVPVLKTPATNTLSQTQVNTLTWNASSAPVPDHYEIQISTKTGTDFESAIVHQNTNVLSFSYTTPALGRVATYYWRVRAVTTKGEKSLWSAVWVFKVAPDKPTLVSPTNGSTNILTPTPTLEWNDVTGATNYYIQVSRNSAFTSLLVNKLTGSTASEFTTPALVEGIPVYWRVYTVSAVGNGSYSDVWSFTTADAPTVPVLKTPVTNSLLQTNTATLIWNASTAPVPDHYEIQISTKTGVDFESAIVHQNTNVSVTTYTTPILNRATAHYWRVRAVTTTGQKSLWSTVWVFKIAPAVPTLTSPIDGASNILSLRPTFDWNDVSGATNYYIQIARNSTFSSLVVNTLTNSAQSTYVPAVNMPEGVTLYWRVYAVSAVGNGSYSTPFSFLSADPSTAPVLALPATNSQSIGDSIILSWKASTAPVPAKYEIQISTNPTASFDTGIVQSNANIAHPTLSYTSTPLARGRVYYWRVRALTAKGEQSAWSAVWAFKILPSAPTLLYPENNSATVQTTKPTFDWSDVQNATGYYIQVSRNSAFTSLVVNQATGSTLSQFTPTAELPKGTILYWRVYTITTGGNSGYSSIFSFTSASPTVNPVLTSPLNNSSVYSFSPPLAWSFPVGTSRFHVQISSSSTFSGTPEHENTNVLINEYRPTTALPRTNTTYYWRVRTYNTLGHASAWSPTWSFTVKLSPAVASSQTWTMGGNQTKYFNFSHTGESKLLLVGISYRTTNSQQGRIGDVIYGGSPLTRINQVQHGEYATELFYLNPIYSPFDQTLRVTSGVISDSILVTATSFVGVNQTSPLRSTTGTVAGEDPIQYGGSALHSFAVPSAQDELVYAIHTMYSGNLARVTPQTGMTTLKNQTLVNVVTTVNTKPSTSSSTQLGWTTTYQWPWSAIAVSLKGL